jgi:RNA recognition motif-containing protein
MKHTRLYVGNLVPHITEQQLLNLFGTAGEVVGVDRAKTLTFAFVEMASALEAQQAIDQYNGYVLAGSKLIVYGVPPRSHPRLG